uniref:Uncharacterized protein n=1 Tax=Rhizophora mucronata TaxID=61149 RepID=A0A2P2NEK2_RHIMU
MNQVFTDQNFDLHSKPNLQGFSCLNVHLFH